MITGSQNWECNCQIIGVVSNQCIDLNKHAYGLQHQYGISTQKCKVFKGKGDRIYDEKYIDGVISADMICVEYEISNGNECKLSFYNETQDNKLLYSMDLPNGQEITCWYPVFSLYFEDGEVRVVPY